MTATLPKQLPDRADAAWRWGSWPVFLLLVGYALFCHGCHGDEDNELLVWANGVSFHQRHEPYHDDDRTLVTACPAPKGYAFSSASSRPSNQRGSGSIGMRT